MGWLSDTFEIAKHASGKDLYTYRIIPDRGGWMEVQFDINDYIYIYLDRRRRRRKSWFNVWNLKHFGFKFTLEKLNNFLFKAMIRS